VLNHIYIRDLAIVSTLELDLQAGLTALTGETGAGKSILIDALGLALGDKADPGMIRNGCGRAEIVADFDIQTCPEARTWLEEQGLNDDGGCLVRRLLVDGGRSRAFVNARPATTAQLQQLGERLVDIHGQHAHQSLLRPATQRDLLDAYGGHADQARAVADLSRVYRDQDRLLRRLETEGADRAARLDLLSYQVGELEALGLTSAQILDLDAEQRRLGSLGKLQEVGARILTQLDEAEPSVGDTLRHACAGLADLAALDPHLGATLELLDGAAIQVQEAAAALRQYLSALDLDPRQLERIETRLGQVHNLGRKYRCPPEGLPQALEDRRAEHDALERADQDTAALAAARNTARAAYLEHAAGLTAARAEAARRLGGTIAGLMHQLGMGGGAFAVALTPLDADDIGPGGLERIEFQVSANPGQPLAPLAKVASGGELSRIGLAIQVATAQCGRVPSLVFDEVDVGIGGGVAEIVGRLLRQLGTERQVLCVTHLPQVAAQGHHQLRVSKHARDGQTHTQIQPLAGLDRVEEIARMLGGTEITPKTRAHAEEMLGRTGG
jgi:DNA repair protein RecN (Recombination protein N)